MDEPKRKVHDFQKEERIRVKRDFERIFGQGRRVRNSYFVIICYKNNVNKQRMAIVVGRKYGKAHQRNKIKRRIREIFRLNKEKFPPFSDCIVIPHKSVVALSFQEIRESIIHLLESAYV